MTAYFDSSVFLSILSGDASASKIRSLLEELESEKIKIFTSIITVQEVSVNCYKDGTIATDNHANVRKIARIESITRDIALTAAKLEAQIIDGYRDKEKNKQADNKRRKWDCFHIATAQCLKCSWLYSCDDGMIRRQGSLGIKGIRFSLPSPLNRDLFNLES